MSMEERVALDTLKTGLFQERTGRKSTVHAATITAHHGRLLVSWQVADSATRAAILLDFRHLLGARDNGPVPHDAAVWLAGQCCWSVAPRFRESLREWAAAWFSEEQILWEGAA